MLFGINGGCSVVLNGKVYIGGGYADRDKDRSIIQVYTSESNGWSRLPECPVKLFAMAVVNQQLVLVGGYSRDGHDQSAILVWDSTSQRWATPYPNMPTARTSPVTRWLYSRDQSTILLWDGVSQRWTTPYPNMPTARTSPAAVGYQQFLVVAGGHGGSFLTTVEILNSSTKRWSTASSLPIWCIWLTPAVAGDILYLLGGCLEPASKCSASPYLPSYLMPSPLLKLLPPPGR